MKKIIYCLMIFLTVFCVSIRVEAKTLKDLKDELAAYEKEMSQAKNKKNMTQSEINSINARVKKIRDTIAIDQDNIKKTEDEIVVLEQKANEKEEQIKGASRTINQFSGMLATMLSDKKLYVSSFGGSYLPKSISIFPVDFKTKDNVTNYLKDWN